MDTLKRLLSQRYIFIEFYFSNLQITYIWFLEIRNGSERILAVLHSFNRLSSLVFLLTPSKKGQSTNHLTKEIPEIDVEPIIKHLILVSLAGDQWGIPPLWRPVQ